MHSFAVLTILVAAISSVVAPNPATYAPRTSSTLRVFESLRESPQGWTKLEKPDPAKRLRLRIALQEPDHGLFEKTLFEVSDPEHPSYGQHLKRHEVKALIKPRDDSTEAVLSWLKSAGIQDADIEDNGEWVNFYVSVSKAEEMLDTEFNYWEQEGAKSRSKEIRTLKYSVPLGVSSHIVMIQPTTRFGQLMAQGSHSFVMSHINADTQAKAKPIPGLKVNETCKSVITPECLRSMYNVGDYRADSKSGSLLGVCGYLNQIAKYDAYEAFTDKYAPYAKNQNFSYVKIKGGMDDQLSSLDDTEANLDIQYAGAMGYKQKLRYYSTAGLGPLIPDLDQPSQDRNQNEPYMDFLDYILGLDDDDLPQTLTTSYGEDEQSLPDSYAKTVCNMFGQLGMRGVSVLFSSGDTGVGSACQTNDGKNTTRFLPIFPAACPYVTSVGATFNYPEEAIFFSSGGFSDKWPRPSYQDAVIPTYLKTLGSQWKGLYNPNGRGFPDVAAQGSNFAVYHRENLNHKLEVILVGGTSASAPAFAGIVSLLNNARLQIGQRPLGFLNPWLYSKGKDGLNDVVLGGSKGCTGRDIYSGLKTPFVPFASWNATKGWDPVTGLGTPNFEKLLDISTPRNRLPHIRNCPDEFC